MAYLPPSLGGNASAAESVGVTQDARQDLTDKVGAAVKPDSQKTFGEKSSDFVKGKADEAAAFVQPDSQKVRTDSDFLVTF
ncbi:hypothetical protein T439DRAFT_294443 [Meredithblackwellia eburnea MCA 4105]